MIIQLTIKIYLIKEEEYQMANLYLMKMFKDVLLFLQSIMKKLFYLMKKLFYIMKKLSPIMKKLSIIKMKIMYLYHQWLMNLFQFVETIQQIIIPHRTQIRVITTMEIRITMTIVKTTIIEISNRNLQNLVKRKNCI